MGIYITGDVHGTNDFVKLLRFHPETGNQDENFLIITGDFGLIWKDECDFTEENIIKFIESTNYTILFVDGNHENHTRLNKMPTEMWNGGYVHRISPHIIHLMRGQIFDINGKRYFTMGGAASTDKQYRIEDVSWWAAEIPNTEERKTAEKNLKACKWRVDYVITHTAPSAVIKEIGAVYRIDEYTEWLQKMDGKLHYSKWFFGHFHEDLSIKNGKYNLLYKEFIYVE